MALHRDMYSHGWSWPWILLNVLFWAAVIVAGALLLRWALQRRGQPPPPNTPSPAGPGPDSDPERLLAQRFARGEIDEAEYRGRLAVLREDAGPAG